MAKKIVEKVYIDGNVVVKSGTFFCKHLVMFADKKDADKIIDGEQIQDGIFEITENYGSPYVEYLLKGGFTLYDGSGIMYPEKMSYNLASAAKEQLAEIRTLLNITIPNNDLYALFYREQYLASISVLENFLYCMVLKELIFDRDVVLNNIRTFNYVKDKLGIKDHLCKDDNELFLIITDKAQKIVYHTFVEVEVLYKIVFKKDIRPILKSIKPTMKKRHNIAHRNGRELNGEIDHISKLDVENLIGKVENITQSIWDLIKSE